VEVASIGVNQSCNNYVGYATDFIDENSVAWWYQTNSCSPTQHAYFSITRTNNSFASNSYLSIPPLSSFNYSACYNHNKELKDVDFVSGDSIYILYECGGYPFFVRTFDGGTTWSDLSTNNRPPNLTFINGKLGYGFFNNNFYRFWSDSLYFVSTLSSALINYQELYFADSLNGYVLFGRSQNDHTADSIIKTNDGGLTWLNSPIPNGRKFDSKSLQVINNTVAYVYADSGDVFKTSDGGNTWVKNIKYDSLGYIQFLSEDKLYNMVSLAGNSYFSMSADSGSHWVTSVLPNYYIFGFRMINDSVGYANGSLPSGGPNMKFLKIESNAIGIQETEKKENILNVFPNPNNGNFKIQTNIGLERILLEVFNIYGEIIYSSMIPQSGSGEIHLNCARPGIYFVKASNGKYINISKVVVE
jgi:hypothetical protein